jgi:16S rRNA (cytosine1402-N4)-methyltransferase
MPEYHRAVLLNETIALLDPKQGGTYLDATLGGGGHSAEIAKRIGPSGTLIAIDRDWEAIEHASKRLDDFAGSKIFVEANFRDLRSILDTQGISELDGALFDFGVSSHQVDSARGFTFSREEPLDMRMGRDARSAARIVNEYAEFDLARVIRDYGEERYGRRIAKAIVERRANKPIRTTTELAGIIVSAIPGGGRWQDIHPATRTFQAIRIEANAELEAIEEAIPAAVGALKVGAVIVTISFHSLEDRIVKTIFRRLAGKCECPPRMPVCVCGATKLIKVLTSKPVTPSAEEIESNPRSRSAKLRAAVRIG